MTRAEKRIVNRIECDLDDLLDRLEVERRAIGDDPARIVGVGEIAAWIDGMIGDARELLVQLRQVS